MFYLLKGGFGRDEKLRFVLKYQFSTPVNLPSFDDL